MKLLIVDTFYGPYLERLYAGGFRTSDVSSNGFF